MNKSYPDQCASGSNILLMVAGAIVFCLGSASTNRTQQVLHLCLILSLVPQKNVQNMKGCNNTLF